MRRPARTVQAQEDNRPEALVELTEFDGGELEKFAKRLDSRYQRCQAKADDISGCIESIETVAGDLFKEWEREADTMSNRDLQRQSLDQLLLHLVTATAPWSAAWSMPEKR